MLFDSVKGSDGTSRLTVDGAVLRTYGVGQFGLKKLVLRTYNSVVEQFCYEAYAGLARTTPLWQRTSRHCLAVFQRDMAIAVLNKEELTCMVKLLFCCSVIGLFACKGSLIYLRIPVQFKLAIVLAIRNPRIEPM